MSLQGSGLVGQTSVCVQPLVAKDTKYELGTVKLK